MGVAPEHILAGPFEPARILGVETSCDETSLAVLENGQRILASLVSSQAELHRTYGGVVPELACRKHLETLHPLLKECLARAEVDLRQLDAVAVTCGPGLIGAVLVGVAFAKALALALERPLIGVNHLEGHLYSLFLEQPDLPFPLVCLLVSGGHTLLLLVEAPGRISVLGQTRDDAAGEAFDKVAKLLGLGYPGGPVVDRLARAGDPASVNLPRPMLDRGYEFSFSGLKTAVLQRAQEVRPEDMCAAFQEAVVDTLVAKTLRAAEQHGVSCVGVAGGVACNSRLRERLEQACQAKGLRLCVPGL
ncbi:MAG: tRNA (adenosine(37)-N6)-threonylcarbamoyltransferase complex transferase subunit TsaD, partial [Candidatus Eremiobacterota bacterium]